MFPAEEQAMVLQESVQLISYDPGLDTNAMECRVQRCDAIHVPAEVHDDTRTDNLACQRCACGAWNKSHTVACC